VKKFFEGTDWNSTLTVKEIVFMFICFWLACVPTQGCLNADWIQEAEEVSKQDAFNRCNPKDREGSLPEGTVCRPAHCSRDKGNYSPRGICEYNGDLEGVYCSPIQPVVIWCAVSEVCGKVVENSQGTQAICKFDLD
tara:strand:+ start:2536 stop:2946 length:411 start_codon:yes stop_codon:yes gene_type:complete